MPLEIVVIDKVNITSKQLGWESSNCTEQKVVKNWLDKAEFGEYI